MFFFASQHILFKKVSIYNFAHVFFRNLTIYHSAEKDLNVWMDLSLSLSLSLSQT